MSRHWLALVLALLLGAAVFGAWQLAFLCDDAFITFRYVANAHDGHGLVWNREPFLPVEGYTGFLWALLLWAAWSWFGVEPPQSANVLSIAFGIVQWALVAAAALRLRDRDGRPLARGLCLLAIAVITSNRTFLQWFTSGLETALFHAAFVGWVLHAFRRRGGGTIGWWLGWSGFAAVAALTRPDGLLFVAATASVAVVEVARRGLPPRTAAFGLLPLLAAAAHVAWRRSFYGEWLPNTYYAKVTGAWPEAGLRYLACFVVEHGVWLAAPLAFVWLAVELARGPRAAVAAVWRCLAATAAVAAVLFHFAYYTLVVGGDHFEYRVYAHLVPLGGLAFATMLARLRGSSVATAVALVLLGVASSLGWLHLWLTRDMPIHGFRPIAAELPRAVQPFGHWFDRQQAWLRFHMVGLRCNHHAIFLERVLAMFPPPLPVQGGNDPFPVFATGAVGGPGWALRGAVILDLHGLNDWIVARTPVPKFAAPPSRDALRPLVAATDADHDGFLDRGELREAIRRLAPDNPDADAPDYLASVFLAIYSFERPGKLSAAEAERIGESLAGARSMAHERMPPPGYVEGLSPNVAVQNGVATATPRAVPLTAEAIRAFEAEWRRRVVRQRG